jgi:hypothetical protein
MLEVLVFSRVGRICFGMMAVTSEKHRGPHLLSQPTQTDRFGRVIEIGIFRSSYKDAQEHDPFANAAAGEASFAPIGSEEIMRERQQPLETTIFVQGLLIGTIFTAISRIEPDFKQRLLTELKAMSSTHPNNGEVIARTIKVIEDACKGISELENDHENVN